MVEPIINTESLSYYDKLIKDFIENHNYELKKFKFEDLNMVNPYFKEKIDNNINSGFLPSEVEFKTPDGYGSYTGTVLIYWSYDNDNNMLSFILSGNIGIDKDEETNEEYIFGAPLALDENYDGIIPEGKGFILHSFIAFLVNGNSELEEIYKEKKFIYLMDGGSYDYLKDFKNYIGNVLSTYFTQLKYLIVPRDSEAIENNIPIFYTEENPDEPDNPTKGLIKDSGKKFNDTSFIKFNYLYGAYYDSTVEEGRVPIYTKETSETLKSGSIIYSDINCTNRIGSIKNVLSSGNVELNIEGKTEIVNGYLTSTYETYSNDLIPTENSVYNYINEQAYTNNEDVNNIIENKLGGNELSTKVYSLRNTTDDTQLVYSLNDLTLAPVGTIVYQDKDCTIEYGKVTYNMSGTLKIDTDQSINWALNGSEDYVSDKRIATEAGVKNYVDEQHSEKEWTTNSDANDYTTSGVYQFAGWRKNQNDNLPIANYDEDGVDRNNIAFTLIVNAKEGYLVRNDEGNVTRNIPTMIAQTLMLGNRRGSDTKIYTRHGQTDIATNTTTWEAWREVMTSTYLGTVDSYTGDVLNGATEIGLYTGAMVNMASNTADVFKLEVINNYAVTTQVSAAMGTSIPNSVLQTITILNLDGSNATKKRTGTYNGSGYDWSEWKEEVGGVSTTKFKRGDVVYYSNYNGKPHFGVMPFEDYVKNPTNDNLTRNPIGLVADPVKRTFVFCSLFNKSFASINAMENLLCGYSSFENGSETFKRLENLGNKPYPIVIETVKESFPAFYYLRKQSFSDGVFYLKNYTAYIPSYKEWLDIYNELWEPYTDDNGISASYLDRILAYRNGAPVSGNEYTNTVQNYSVFYYQLSTLGLASCIDSETTKHLNTFGGNGQVQDWDNYNYNVCPVFGIYTEEEENNYPEF